MFFLASLKKTLRNYYTQEYSGEHDEKTFTHLGGKRNGQVQDIFWDIFFTLNYRTCASTVAHSEPKLEKKCKLKNMCLHDYLKG